MKSTGKRLGFAVFFAAVWMSWCSPEAANAQPYQLHNDGWIYRFTGNACVGTSCTSWQLLDKNPQTSAIVASGTSLFQLHKDGSIYRYTGTPCNGSNCFGWQMLDKNPATKLIAGDNNALYQLHNDGSIYRYTGAPCNGNVCNGWQMLDKNPATVALAVGAQPAGANPAIGLFQLHTDGSIYRSTGAPCNGNVCNGWQMLDKNPATKAIVAMLGVAYQLHNDGSIYRSTGAPCNGNVCNGWQMLDKNPATKLIFAGGSTLYQLHNDGGLYRSTDAPCNGNVCNGWQMLDKNPATKSFGAGAGQFYQLHSDGSLYRFTGTPCNGNTCNGWQMLDKNPQTVAVVMGSTSPPAPTAPPLQDRIANAYQSWLWTNKVGNASLVVMQNGGVIGQYGFGNRTAATVVQVASLTKAITGVCIASLVDAGRLAFTDLMSNRLSALVGGIPTLDPQAKTITVEHLLRHTSGITSDPTQAGLGNIPNANSSDEVLARQALSTALGTKPGSTFLYNNMNYALLGLIIQAVSGEQYEPFCKRMALTPRGAGGASIGPGVRAMKAFGGWQISALEYANFARAFDPRQRLLSAQADAFNNAGTYGLGIQVRRTAAGRNVWHFGNWHGATNPNAFSAYFALWDNDVSVVVTYDTDLNDAARTALDDTMFKAATSK